MGGRRASTSLEFLDDDIIGWLSVRVGLTTRNLATDRVTLPIAAGAILCLAAH